MIITFACAFVGDYGCSFVLLAADLRRRRAVNERAAEFIDRGWNREGALSLASRALAEEAEANARAIEAVMR